MYKSTGGQGLSRVFTGNQKPAGLPLLVTANPRSNPDRQLIYTFIYY